MQQAPQAPDDLLDRIREAGVDIVHLQFTDVLGAIKGLTVPVERLRGCLEGGVWFDGSSVEGMARLAESDLYLRPDLSTFAVLPWKPAPTARLLCDLYLPDGSRFPADPRGVLKTALDEAAVLGFDYRVGCEVEFFVFANDRNGTVPGGPPVPVDGRGYFEEPSPRVESLCRATVRGLADFGFDVEAVHHEVAPGQHEIDLADLGALQAADAIVALKWMLRAMARQEGLLVSFMPKPLAGVSGSGLHLQQSLVDRANDTNVFSDPTGGYGLSAIAGHFIAGQLVHARAMCAVIAPLVNSYKRLMGGAEAPCEVSWARVSRGALIRVPEVWSRGSTRVELRAADPSCNPYLALAVALKSGLDGIANGLPLPEPLEEAASPSDSDEVTTAANPLRKTLEEALEELEWNPVVRAAIGQPIYERLLTAKEQEAAAFREHISAWELAHYLESA